MVASWSRTCTHTRHTRAHMQQPSNYIFWLIFIAWRRNVALELKRRVLVDPEKILWESKKKTHVGFYGDTQWNKGYFCVASFFAPPLPCESISCLPALPALFTKRKVECGAIYIFSFQNLFWMSLLISKNCSGILGVFLMYYSQHLFQLCFLKLGPKVIYYLTTTFISPFIYDHYLETKDEIKENKWTRTFLHLHNVIGKNIWHKEGEKRIYSLITYVTWNPLHVCTMAMKLLL